MPVAQYNKFFGGKKGAAAKAKRAMVREYGEKEGEHIFYAKKNKNKLRMAGGHPRRARSA